MKRFGGLRWVGVVLLAGACGGRDDIARVGSTRVSNAEVVAYARTHGAVPPERALDAIVARTLLAEGAREKGLDRQPDVAARLAEARREILASALIDRVTADALSEKALRARYETEKDKLTAKQVHVEQLIVRLAPAATEREKAVAHAKVDAAYARLKTGAAFADVVKEVSDDPISAAHGGDVGPILEGQVDPAFFNAVAALKKGELSKPFETRFGLHLAQALEDPQNVVPAFEQVRGRLAAEARFEVQQKLQEELAKKITVKRYPERLELRADGGSR